MFACFDKRELRKVIGCLKRHASKYLVAETNRAIRSANPDLQQTCGQNPPKRAKVRQNSPKVNSEYGNRSRGTNTLSMSGSCCFCLSIQLIGD